MVDKIELTEDMAAELDWNMRGLKVGMMVTVVYFSKDEYLKKMGIVSRIDVEGRILQIVEAKIAFDDLLKIETEHKKWCENYIF